MTVAYLLILTLLAFLALRAARRKRITLLILSVLLILPCALLLYFSVYYRAGEDARRTLPDRDAVPVGIWIEGLGILSVSESISVRVGKSWVRVVD